MVEPEKNSLIKSISHNNHLSALARTKISAYRRLTGRGRHRLFWSTEQAFDLGLFPPLQNVYTK
jgi:hypothetical protein